MDERPALHPATGLGAMEWVIIGNGIWGLPKYHFEEIILTIDFRATKFNSARKCENPNLLLSRGITLLYHPLWLVGFQPNLTAWF